MIAWTSQWHCEEVRPYYYDYLKRSARSDIPESVVTHIQSCDYCRGQVEELMRVLEDASVAGGVSKQGEPWLRMIHLHFQLADQAVACHHIRPFLPVLLHPDYSIRIATPVMDHLRACSTCQKDLETLKALDLNPSQLRRLSDCFGTQSSNAIPGPHLSDEELTAFAMGQPVEWDPLTGNHLCLCPSCATRLGEIWKESLSLEREECPICAKTTESQLFEWVFPYQETELPCPQGSDSLSRDHGLNCPTGRKRALALWQDLMGIAHRLDSGVVTHFDLEQAGLLAEQPDFCQVDVDGRRAPKSVLPVRDPQFYWRRLKPIAVAAVVLLVVGLLIPQFQSTAEAGLCARVRQVLAQSENVKIIDRLPQQTTPSMIMWVVKEAQLLASQKEAMIEVHDLGNQRTIRRYPDGHVQETTLSSEEARSLREHQLATAWGLLTAIRSIPEESIWQEQRDDASSALTYELILDGRFGGQVRWVIEFERTNDRPIRIERYYRQTPEDRFKADRISEIVYGSAEDMSAEIRGLLNP